MTYLLVNVYRIQNSRIPLSTRPFGLSIWMLWCRRFSLFMHAGWWFGLWLWYPQRQCLIVVQQVARIIHTSVHLFDGEEDFCFSMLVDFFCAFSRMRSLLRQLCCWGCFMRGILTVERKITESKWVYQDELLCRTNQVRNDEYHLMATWSRIKCGSI